MFRCYMDGAESTCAVRLTRVPAGDHDRSVPAAPAPAHRDLASGVVRHPLSPIATRSLACSGGTTFPIQL